MSDNRKSGQSLLIERKQIAMHTSDPKAGGWDDWLHQALKALSGRRKFGLPRVYQRGGLLCRVRPGAVGSAARLEQLDIDALRVLLAEVCDFVEWRENKSGTEVPRVLPPPVEVLRSLLSLAKYSPKSFPALELLSDCPLLGQNGRLIEKRGFYRAERLWLEPRVVLSPVPARPTKDEVQAAVSLIMDEFLGDFPFADSASRAHALSVVLTPLCRRLVPGPTPLHLTTAASPGTGKTLLLTALSTVAAGAPVSPQPMRANEEETAKGLLAVLLTGGPYCFFDNITAMDSPTIAIAIASPACRFAGRLLGASKWIDLPALTCWLASGNNPTLSREMARRTVLITLATDLEKPWTRAGFRHPDLIRWSTAHRAELLGAALTICRAWVAQGMPKGTENLGGFESWSEVLGGVLEVAEIPGFLENRNTLLQQDEEGQRWTAVTRLWWVRHRNAVVSIDQVFQLIVSVPELEVSFAGVLGSGADRLVKLRLGQALATIGGRVFGEHRVEVTGDTIKGFPTYRLFPVGAATPGDGAATPGAGSEPGPGVGTGASNLDLLMSQLIDIP